MKNRFTEERIIGVRKGVEAGGKVADLCREHGISDVAYYNWKAKYGVQQDSLEEQQARVDIAYVELPGCLLDGSIFN